MKKNTFFKNITNDSTIIDIDDNSSMENKESKYIYYPSPQRNNSQRNNSQNINVNVNKFSKLPPLPKVVNTPKIGNVPKVENNSPVNKPIVKEIKSEIEKNIVEKVEKKSPVKVEMTKSKNVKTETKTETKTKVESQEKSQEVIKKNEIEYTEEDLLFNLKIISELNISDKLSYDDKLFSIDNPTYTQGLSRWWYGEDRAKTLEKLNNIIDATFKYMDNTFTNKVNLIGSKNIDEGILYENNSQVMQKFYATLLETIKGLEKLKNTYIHDKSMTTGLNLLIERIRRRTVKIDEISRIVPHSNLH